MVAYATEAQVLEEFKELESGTDDEIFNPTQIERFIEEESATINAYLAGRYAFPITGVESLSLLEKICIDCVACRMEKILNLKKPVHASNQRIKQEMNECDACQWGKDLLEDIKNGKLKLPDEASLDNNKPWSYTSANNVQPIFLRDVDQW